MNKMSLTVMVREQLLVAESASNGRSSHTVYGGHEHVLRQTLIALAPVSRWRSTPTRARPPSTCCTAT